MVGDRNARCTGQCVLFVWLWVLLQARKLEGPGHGRCSGVRWGSRLGSWSLWHVGGVNIESVVRVERWRDRYVGSWVLLGYAL